MGWKCKPRLLILLPVISVALCAAWLPEVTASHLPPEVGDRLAQVIRSPEVRSALPSGWTIRGVSLEPDRIILNLAGPAGEESSMELRSKETPELEGGRWFSYHLGTGDRSGAMQKDLLRLAAQVDDAFPESPWVGAGTEDELPRVRPARNESDRNMQFLALTLVGGEFLAIVAFLLVAVRYLRRHPGGTG